MKKILPLLIILAHSVVTASPIPDFPFIAVDGNASTEVPPDTAVINFKVLVYDADPSAATKKVNSTLREVTDAIIALGIPKTALTADDLDKRAVRERGENYKDLKILGYDVSRCLKIEIANIERYTAVVSLVMKTNNITSVYISFDTVKRKDIESVLVGKACADAKRKALLMSKGVGTELGSVFAVSDRDFTSINERFGFGYSGTLNGSGGGEEVPIFVPAKIHINASVNVLYRLGKKQNSEQGVAPDS